MAGRKNCAEGGAEMPSGGWSFGERGGKNDAFLPSTPKDTCISAVVYGNFRLKWACCVIESLNDLELGEI